MTKPKLKRVKALAVAKQLGNKPWVRLAGSISGPADLSLRRGVSRGTTTPSSMGGLPAQPQIEGAERRKKLAHGVSRGFAGAKRPSPVGAKE
jgi:hypothetical protein